MVRQLNTIKRQAEIIQGQSDLTGILSLHEISTGHTADNSIEMWEVLL